MTLARRTLLQGAAALTASTALPAFTQKRDEIVIGSLHDLTGGLEVLGKPMEHAVQLAIAEINAAGGLLGQQVRVVTLDAQSNNKLYKEHAHQLALADKVAVVFGGITSVSREIIRPITDRFNTLYFYNTFYEGGVCDRNIFCTGLTPAQNLNKLVPYVVRRWGRKIHVVAADYNYGRITTDWIKKFAKDSDAEVVAVDFFKLDVDQFGAAIQKIQAAKPDLVMSVLIGAKHQAFYSQWAAAGLHGKIPVAATTFGTGNEHLALPPSEVDGLVTAYSYYDSLDTDANDRYVANWRKKFGASYPAIGELATATYQAVHLWALGVKKAESIDRIKTIEALESGLSFNGPSGRVTIDPATHHCTLDVKIAELKNRKWQMLTSFRQQPPLDTAAVCDLKKNPGDRQQYVIKI